MRIVHLCLLLGMIGMLESCSSGRDVPTTVEGTRPPTVIKRVDPRYPQELREQRVEGAVVVEGIVPKEGGTMRALHVVRSDDTRLDQLALDAISKWIWMPGLQDGRPSDVEFTTQVRFLLNR